MTRVLVAEDEPGIASFVAKGLRGAGYEVDVVGDGPTAAARARAGDIDLVVLDLGLPGMDGLDVLRSIRGEDERIPVIILTARDELGSTVAGFERGADDYMTKPFRFEELLARVRARLRNAQTDAPILKGGGIALDLHGHRAHVGDRVVDLTTREFALAEELLRHPDEVLDRDHLLRNVWGDDVDAASNVVDVYVLYLRRKIGDGFVETVRGRGYRLGVVRPQRQATKPATA